MDVWEFLGKKDRMLEVYLSLPEKKRQKLLETLHMMLMGNHQAATNFVISNNLLQYNLTPIVYLRDDIINYVMRDNPGYFTEHLVYQMFFFKEVPEAASSYFNWCRQQDTNYKVPSEILVHRWKAVHDSYLSLEIKIFRISLLLLLNRNFTYNLAAIVSKANCHGTLELILGPFRFFNCQCSNAKKISSETGNSLGY